MGVFFRFMDLMLLRHAEAENAGPEIESDEARPLSAAGARNARAVGRGLRRLDLVPEAVLTSPLLRARQTAEQVLEGLGDGPAPEEMEALRPGATPGTLLPALQKRQGLSRVLLIGHQPDVGRILSFLISGGSMELEFAIRPATLAVVELDTIPLRRAGRLWLLAGPAVLDRAPEGLAGGNS